jgi:subtilisin family serine protease
MGASRRRRREASDEPPAEPSFVPTGPDALTTGLPTGPEMTGRYLVLMNERAVDKAMDVLAQAAGLSVARAAEFGAGPMVADTLAESEALVFEHLGVAVVAAPPDQLQSLSAAAAGEPSILVIEPEQVMYAIQERPGVPGMPTTPPGAVFSQGVTQANRPVEYYVGYRDAVNHLVEQMLGGGTTAAAEAGIAAVFDESQLTWGLQATNVAQSQFTGAGVRVAVLDTGLDLSHPDFLGRAITSRSFVAGEEVQDGHGHGTHCIGTACGPKQPGQLPRYGVAYEAEIFAGKVLNNQGRGTDGSILAGINWAVDNGCRVVSMSLGAPVAPNQSFSRIYETAARRALAAGTLIVAAAGNESQRPGTIAPVGRPANAPSIIAVAAIDRNFQIAWFSCGGINPQGGQVDIAGPGVSVRSSWPRPTLYRTINGTSMATPHVAGIAALHAQANPDVQGGALGWLLLQSARRLVLPARDVGAGLVQAP